MTTTPEIQAALSAWAGALVALRSAQVALDNLGHAASQVDSTPRDGPVDAADLDDTVDTAAHLSWLIRESYARLWTDAPYAVIQEVRARENDEDDDDDDDDDDGDDEPEDYDPTPALWVDAVTADMA